MIGIDIGSTYLKLALCDGMKVRQLVSEPLPDNLVRDGRVVSLEAMAAFLKETLSKHRVRGRRCTVLLPASLTFTRRTTMPVMTVEQLKLNLPYELLDYLKNEKDKFFYSYQLLDMIKDDKGVASEMDLYIAATQKTTIRDYKSMCRWAGLKLVAAIPIEYSFCKLIENSQASHPELAGTSTCIIDLGHRTTNIYIFNNGLFDVSRQIENGCGQLDAIIAEALNVDEHIAVTHKLVNQNGVLELPACQEVYSSLAIDVMRALNFYSYNHGGTAIQAAWLCGGGCAIAPMVAQLHATLQLDIHPIRHLLESQGDDDDQLAICTSAIGAAQP